MLHVEVLKQKKKNFFITSEYMFFVKFVLIQPSHQDNLITVKSSLYQSCFI